MSIHRINCYIHVVLGVNHHFHYILWSSGRVLGHIESANPRSWSWLYRFSFPVISPSPTMRRERWGKPCWSGRIENCSISAWFYLLHEISNSPLRQTLLFILMKLRWYLEVSCDYYMWFSAVLLYLVVHIMHGLWLDLLPICLLLSLLYLYHMVGFNISPETVIHDFWALTNLDNVLYFLFHVKLVFPHHKCYVWVLLCDSATYGNRLFLFLHLFICR